MEDFEKTEHTEGTYWKGEFVMKRISSLLLSASLLLMGCASIGGADEADAVTQTADSIEEYSAVYQPIIDDFYRLISGQTDVSAENGALPTGSMGLREALSVSEGILDDTGYRIADLSGDGIPELLIGSVSSGMIYALFTTDGDSTELLLEGVYRNSYYLLDDGTVANQGSGGAIYSIFGVYGWSEDGRELTCIDCWFTHEKDGNFEDIRCYHNTSGEMDPAVSEELSMTLDAFYTMQDSLLARVTVPALTTFAQYNNEA